MRAHALLSPSSAERWINCPPSARLSESIEQTISVYAEEGTLAHKLAELELQHKVAKDMTKKEYKEALREFEYQAEMKRYVEVYVDYVKSIIVQYDNPEIGIERKVDISAYAPESFGTVDCSIIGEKNYLTDLHIIDFKYGKGVEVTAENNKQLMLYALGEYESLCWVYGINYAHLHIVQPRIDNIQSYKISIDELKAFGEYVKNQSMLAWKGEGKFCVGSHCKFCPAKAVCRERGKQNIAILEAYQDTIPATYNNAEIGKILSQVKDFPNWVKDLQEYALQEILKGNAIPGWKAVEGRSNRKFTDEEQVKRILTDVVDDEQLYETKFKTLATLEKIIGVEEFYKLVGEYIYKPKGSPSLASFSDKRPEYREISAQDEFINNKKESV